MCFFHCCVPLLRDHTVNLDSIVIFASAMWLIEVNVHLLAKVSYMLLLIKHLLAFTLFY